MLISNKPLGDDHFMTQIINVYFKTEDEAEKAKSRLQQLKIKDISVEEMPEASGTTIYVPFFPTNTGTPATSGSQGGLGSVTPIIPAVEADDKAERNDHLMHLLRIEIEDQDYEEAVSILKEQDCYRIRTEKE